MEGSKETGAVIKERILLRLETSGDIPDEELMRMIDEEIMRENRLRPIPLERRMSLGKELFCSLRRLDVLQEFLDDDSITEIMVNGTDSIYIERGGRIEKSGRRFTSTEKLEDVIMQIVGRVNRTVNEANPIVDARLDDGSRVNAVLRAAALNGPILTIRKFAVRSFSMDYMVSQGMLPLELAGQLADWVRERRNMFISGGTGSGKTTFLNALSAYIPPDERIITIEDSAELQIQGVENKVRLEARRATGEGEREITIRDLIKTALRMRPDRIIVGEVRDGSCIDMLQAMNTGHDGSLSTGHARSAYDMLSRMETMAMMGADLPLAAIRGQIASAIDVIIHLGRDRDGSRHVETVIEVLGYDREKGEYIVSTVYKRH